MIAPDTLSNASRTTKNYDAIVIGAGGMGSATAYHLAKAGTNVLVLEQFQRAHSFGSSHGETRIIRLFYDKPFYTELMKSAYAEWRAVEMEASIPLLTLTGSISLGVAGNHYSMATRDSLTAAGVASEMWDVEQLAHRFPQFHVPKEMDILWQQDSGFLHAAACVSTLLQLAERHGATVRENTPVTRIDWQTESPCVETAAGRFHARKIIVTAGAWTTLLLAELNLPLTVTRQQVCYYRPADAAPFQTHTGSRGLQPRPHLPNAGRPGLQPRSPFPVFVEVTAQNEFLYGIPYFGKNGVKVARHGGGQPVSPDTCNRTPDTDYIERLDTYVQERIPSLGKAVHAEVCLYTETPDEDFIIDAHPDCPDVLIAAGFSGHGFKFCALVGRILQELAQTGKTDFDISHFSINRTVKMP